MLQQTPTNALPIQEPLSARELIQATKLEDDARKLATNQKPLAAEVTPCQSEQTVCELVEERIAQRNLGLDAHAAAIEQQLNALPVLASDRNQHWLPQHVSNCLMKVFQDRTPVIKEAVTTAKQKESNYLAYKSEHSLEHKEPDYPDSKLLPIAILFSLMIAEALLNMMLFKEATTTGLLGGFVVALAIGAANITLAVAIGLVPMRYLNLPTPPHKWWAVPTIGLGIVLIAFINFYAAHFREVATSVEKFSQSLVLSHMLYSPLSLSLQSYILLILGLLFAIFAGFKGYGLSDPYPGFESQDRRYRDAEEDLNYLTTSIHGDIEAVRQAEIVIAADNPENNGTLFTQILEAHGQLKQTLIRCTNLEARDIEAANRALTRFQTLNLAIRTDGVTPAYFNQKADFSAVTLEPKRFDYLEQLIGEAEEEQQIYAAAHIALISRMLARIEAAKDNTAAIMLAINKSCVDDNAVPDLSEIRSLITKETASKPVKQG